MSSRRPGPTSWPSCPPTSWPATLPARSSTRPDGFVVEGPTAGGHNAPPARPAGGRRATGEPVYGPRDDADLEKVAALGIPFWVAGWLRHARAVSRRRCRPAQRASRSARSSPRPVSPGLTPELRARPAGRRLTEDSLAVRTDVTASPTGFPFKVARVPGTADSDAGSTPPARGSATSATLREPYVRADGRSVTGARPSRSTCSSARVAKPGADRRTSCLCNALTANIGLAQHRRTATSSRAAHARLGSGRRAGLLHAHPHGWSAGQVVGWLLGQEAAVRQPGAPLRGHCLAAPRWAAYP